MKVPTGSKVFDELLGGGYESDVITTIYGPAASGKTTACMLCSIPVSKKKKIIFIDTEGGFSIERLKQLTKNYEKVLKNMLFLNPTTFEEQRKDFDKLRKLVNDKIGLIVVDTISNLYRAEFTKEDVKELNRDMGRQLSHLVEIARKRKIPILLTNQVYADFDNKDNIKIVGGDLLKYTSKCLIELKIVPKNKRAAILRKHRHIPEKKAFFEIQEKGFFPAKQEKGFKLF